MVETLADDIREDGIQEGEKNTQLSIAASMINKGFDLNLISEITGLDKKQIEAIKTEVH